jgi:hypothetical protein
VINVIKSFLLYILKIVNVLIHINNITGHDVKPEEAGIVTAHIKNAEKQPFMVAFFKSSPHSAHPTLPVSVRSHDTDVEDDEGEENNDLEADMLREAQIHRVHSRSRRETRRKKKTADMSHVPDMTHYKHIFTGWIIV